MNLFRKLNVFKFLVRITVLHGLKNGIIKLIQNHETKFVINWSNRVRQHIFAICKRTLNIKNLREMNEKKIKN